MNTDRVLSTHAPLNSGHAGVHRTGEKTYVNAREEIFDAFCSRPKKNSAFIGIALQAKGNGYTIQM